MPSPVAVATVEPVEETNRLAAMSHSNVPDCGEPGRMEARSLVKSSWTRAVACVGSWRTSTATTITLLSVKLQGAATGGLTGPAHLQGGTGNPRALGEVRHLISAPEFIGRFATTSPKVVLPPRFRLFRWKRRG